MLRQRRRAAGLTQQELADRAGVAVRTVRDLERGRTARPQRSTAQLLADALGLHAEARTTFLTAVRPGAAPVTPGVPLPPPPQLVGRDGDVAELARVLADRPASAGPVTLVGLSGVGKSALALAVAHRVRGRFPGGVAGVVIDEHGETTEALASTVFVFGAGSASELGQRVARVPALLLLDAVERAPEKVRELLRVLPAGVRVLATGHAPLQVADEMVWPVGGLQLPPPSVEADLAEIASYPAAALLLDRLMRVRAEPLAADEVPALVGLVRRLGGLPLALELAAAHGRLLRLPEILQRYGDRVLDLGAGAERTLREAVAASYRLLAEPQRWALRRLAVFRHRWSVELAEQMLDAEADPIPMLDRLVSLGLVAISGAREHRFRLLDVVRDFATEQSMRHGELAIARRDHARIMARLAERNAPELAGPGLRAAVARLDDLAADIWAALSYAANEDAPTALRLASQLPRWWRFRGRDKAGRRWLLRLLDDPRTRGADPLARAWAKVGLGQLANEHGAGADERPRVQEALAEFAQRDDVAGEVAALNVLSGLTLAQGAYEDARRFTERALQVASRAGRVRDAVAAHTNVTWHEIRQGNLSAAWRRLVAAEQMAARVGDERLRVLVLANLAEVGRLQERYHEAVTMSRRVLHLLGEVGDPGHRRRVLGTLGQSLASLGQISAAEQVLATLRDVPTPGAETVCAMIEARIALARGDRATAAEWFAEAARGFQRGQDRRDVVEALVGVVACTAEPQRRERAWAALAEALQQGGFTLVPAEQALVSGDGAGGPPKDVTPPAPVPRSSGHPPGPRRPPAAAP